MPAGIAMPKCRRPRSGRQSKRSTSIPDLLTKVRSGIGRYRARRDESELSEFIQGRGGARRHAGASAVWGREKRGENRKRRECEKVTGRKILYRNTGACVDKSFPDAVRAGTIAGAIGKEWLTRS
jgi:hypothetical protein